MRSGPRYLRRIVPYPYTRADAEEYIARCVLDQRSTRFGIEYEGHVVGGIELHIDLDKRRAELGYGLAVRCWGGGLLPEAAAAVVHYGFSELGLEKVFAFTDVRNSRSQRVLEKLRFQREGVLRRHEIGRDGKRIEHVYFGLLREEWESRQPG